MKLGLCFLLLLMFGSLIKDINVRLYVCVGGGGGRVGGGGE